MRSAVDANSRALQQLSVYPAAEQQAPALEGGFARPNTLVSVFGNVQNSCRFVSILVKVPRGCFTSRGFAVKTVCWGSAMNKDQVKGQVDQAKGQIKKVTGKVVGNKELEQKGKVQKAVGKVRSDFGNLKEDLKNKP